MGIKENVAIALIDEYDEITSYITRLSQYFTFDVGYNIPQPKLTYYDAKQANGVIDVNPMFDISNYNSTAQYFNNRVINISMTLKNGSSAANYDPCADFINTYNGQRVAVCFGATNDTLPLNYDYCLRGRLSVIGDNQSDVMRQLSVVVDADPLKYSSAYSPSAAGLDIMPSTILAQPWDLSVFEYVSSGVTITDDGFSIPESLLAGSLIFKDTVYTDIGLYKIQIPDYSGNIVVTIEKPYGETSMSGKWQEIHNGSGTFCYYGSLAGARIRFEKVDILAPGATIIGFIVGKFSSVKTFSNDGQDVFADIHNSIYHNSKPLSVYLNGVVFDVRRVSGATDTSGNPLFWTKCPLAKIKHGVNICATFYKDDDDPTPTAGEMARTRWMEGVL